MASQNLVSSSSSSSKLQIEAVQTVTPFKATDPRQTRRVSVAAATADSVIFRTCLNLILYSNNKELEEDSGWIVAGWIKESLAKALVEQPMLSGRLRRGEDGNGDLEIVSNDSGLRLIEAKIAMPLSEFLGSKESEDSETELVFWKDVDEQNPQYSPLFYVQVTNFEFGGYSIGISCSILLSDLLIKEDFIKKWANIHNAMLSKNETKTPIFYLPNHKKASCSPVYTTSSNQNKTCGKAMMFKITDYENVNLENESGRKLMLVCVEEAERELGCKMGAKFPVFSRESSNMIKIESCTKLGDDELVDSQLKLRSQVTGEIWDFLGANEVAFGQGNKPARVQNWIGSVSDGLVIATPSSSSSSVEGTCELNVIVSIPCERIIYEGFNFEHTSLDVM